MLTDHQSASVESPVLEVLRAAGHELRELRDRQVQVTKRIRTLRSTMAALQNLQHGQHAPSNEVESSSRKPLVSPCESDEELRRACRIAMLESAEGLTKDEVFARIVRRGSYHFADIVSAKAALRVELNAMVRDGELECETDESGSKWKRVATARER